MRNFDIRKLQLKEMDLIHEVDRICKKHNINYYLSWGSALGAVRHKGFIPWDDDIDISMFWDDYVKFQKVCTFELSDKFFYQCSKTDKNYWFSWNKLRLNNTTSMDRGLRHIDCHWGVCLDIFPIVGIPDSNFLKRIQKIETKIYKILCSKPILINSEHISKSQKIKKIIFNLVPNTIINSLQNLLLKDITKYSISNNTLCGEILSMPYENSFIDPNIFGQPTHHVFENSMFPIPEKYDIYLKTCYGNYMELPPENERIGHGDIIVDLENSFKKYII